MNQPTMPHRHRTPDDWAARYRTDRDPAAPAAPRPGLWQVPTLFWAALGVWVGTFFVHATYWEYGGTTCSYTDYAAYIGVAVMAGLTVGGWAQRARRAADHRLAAPYAALFTVALAALAVVHVLRGNGTVGGLCG